MESTLTKRIWHKSPPPHVGWWNATDAGSPSRKHFIYWRWWDGKTWSRAAFPDSRRQDAALERKAWFPENVKWTDYWPEGARVPRIDPAVGEVIIGDRLWLIRSDGVVCSAPLPKRNPLGDSAAWQRWAESRNAAARDPLGLASRAGPIYGRTRMVDGNELTKLAGQAGVIAHEARVLADRLNEMIRTAS